MEEFRKWVAFLMLLSYCSAERIKKGGVKRLRCVLFRDYYDSPIRTGEFGYSKKESPIFKQSVHLTTKIETVSSTKGGRP
jgi:hypothetical protein